MWATRLAKGSAFDIKTPLDSEISDLSSKVLRIAASEDYGAILTSK